MRFPDENSPLDYNGYHVNYILQYGWNGYGILHIIRWLEWIWNFEPGGTGCHANFTKWIHSKNNGIVKMENGQLN